MPAVTVEDTLVLPRVHEPDPATTVDRPVLSVTTAPSGYEGEGFPVRRAFAGVDLAQLEPRQRVRPVRSVTTAPHGLEGDGFPVRRAFAGVAQADLDPFIHLDQMGEVEYAPGEAKGTSWHPHRGFETVTYMLDGVFEHHDSNGGGGLITNGDTQWMTAGAGILHIERPPEALVVRGGLFHGLQLWVNLPSSNKMTHPRYQDIRADAISLLSSPDGGALIRVIAGQVGELNGPGVTHTPISIVHASLQPDAEVDLPWRPDFNALVYVLSGAGYVGAERRPLRMGQLAVLGAGDAIRIGADPPKQQESRSPTFEAYIMGGLPIGEPVAWYGPFVMNTHEELAQAFEDYRRGRLGAIPADALQ
jgi:redox-sensitive bicupin YhaK (pirin superfamily)